MLGSLIVWFSLAAALVSCWSYITAARGNSRAASIGRRSYEIMVVGVLGSSALLMTYILTHRFEFAYVWGYSSRSLPLDLLITTFWAGQEGSFMLWLFFSALLGLVLARYARKHGIEAETMMVYSLLMTFLLILVSIKSPFQYIWDAFPRELSPGSVPSDGRGLNPLLQNVWMIVHPPVLFLGFAAMAAPYALALAGLMRKSYTSWIHLALPWILFSVVALGAGLILGGYWAYGVLGWGGWWGWDPVENSSLIPWLVAVALLHTILVQLRTGKLMRTNFVLALVGFVLVVYSTFLTRSGVLSEASVHSFAEPGALSYVLLLVWIAVVVGMAITWVALRWREMKGESSGVGILTRESMLSLGSIALGIIALVVLFGTSVPLVGKSAVEPGFYNATNLPIAIAVALLIGLSLLVQYKIESGEGLLGRAVLGLAVGVVGTVALVIAGLDRIGLMALAFSSFFALAISARHGYRLFRQQPLLIGGAVAHMGVAVLLLSIIGSGVYGFKETVSLPRGEQKAFRGYEITYAGSQVTPDGKYRLKIEARRNGSTTVLTPVMYFSSYNNSLMREPDYATSVLRDFYVEPVSLDQNRGASGAEDTVLTLAKGETRALAGLRVTFVGFDMSPHDNQSARAIGGLPVGAILDIAQGGTTTRVVPVSFFRQGQEPEPEQAIVGKGPLAVSLVSLNVGMGGGSSTVRIAFSGLHAARGPVPTQEVLVAEVSVKPFMVFVWIGAVMIIGGFLTATVKRSKDLGNLPAS